MTLPAPTDAQRRMLAQMREGWRLWLIGGCWRLVRGGEAQPVPARMAAALVRYGRIRCIGVSGVGSEWEVVEDG